MLQLLQQLTGINAILSYGPNIFQSAGVPIEPLAGAFITNCVNLAGTMVLTVSIDRFGRRILLLVGAAGMFVFMVIAAAAGAVIDRMDSQADASSKTALGWIMFISVCLYM